MASLMSNQNTLSTHSLAGVGCVALAAMCLAGPQATAGITSVYCLAESANDSPGGYGQEATSIGPFDLSASVDNMLISEVLGLASSTIAIERVYATHVSEWLGYDPYLEEDFYREHFGFVDVQISWTIPEGPSLPSNINNWQSWMSLSGYDGAIPVGQQDVRIWLDPGAYTFSLSANAYFDWDEGFSMTIPAPGCAALLLAGMSLGVRKR